MITLDGLKVKKDSIKEVIIDGSTYYALTDEFIKIALDNDELLLIYKNCPDAPIENNPFEHLFDEIPTVNLDNLTNN